MMIVKVGSKWIWILGHPELVIIMSSGKRAVFYVYGPIGPISYMGIYLRDHTLVFLSINREIWYCQSSSDNYKWILAGKVPQFFQANKMSVMWMWGEHQTGEKG